MIQLSEVLVLLLSGFALRNSLSEIRETGVRNWEMWLSYGT